LASPADAQRSKDNAVTEASDAFGTVVGNQTIGLYTPTNARGFNPTQAQNVRIEGLYFDQQTSSATPTSSAVATCELESPLSLMPSRHQAASQI